MANNPIREPAGCADPANRYGELENARAYAPAPKQASAIPRITVPRDKPLACATAVTPPKPIALASAAGRAEFV